MSSYYDGWYLFTQDEKAEYVSIILSTIKNIKKRSLSWAKYLTSSRSERMYRYNTFIIKSDYLI